jgi:hypothetical protein
LDNLQNVSEEAGSVIEYNARYGSRPVNGNVKQCKSVVDLVEPKVRWALQGLNT